MSPVDSTNIGETAHVRSQMYINHVAQPEHSTVSAHTFAFLLPLTPTVRHTTRGGSTADEKAEQRHAPCHRGAGAPGADRSRKRDEGSPLQ